MTPRELLTEGRLADAIVAQRAIRDASVRDHAATLALFELLVVAGKFLDANAELKAFLNASPEHKAYAYAMNRVLRAERRRQHGFKPTLLGPPPLHMRCRWNAVKYSRLGNEEKAVKWADRAEARMPGVRGHVNGREFRGLRDADDRFAGVFEFLAGGRYHWVPFEQIKTLTLGPPEGILDTVIRPAEIVLKPIPNDPKRTDKHSRSLAPRAELRQPAKESVVSISRVGQSLPLAERADHSVRGHVPLVYPGTAFAGKDDAFTLGQDADFTEAAGLVIGIGERVLTIGEEELPLGEVVKLEFK
jgi:type VI secretion system protein ImpE